MKKRWMVIDPGPMSTPGRIVREVDMDNLPETVIVEGYKFKRTELRPRYHLKKEDALRDAAKRVVRDVGAPGGISKPELRGMSAVERAEIRDMKVSARKRYAKYLR